MSIYEEYYQRYKKKIQEQKVVDFVIRDYMWITFQFLEDRKVDPWEKEKFEALIQELQEKKELEMIQAIIKTIRFTQKLDS